MTGPSTSNLLSTGTRAERDAQWLLRLARDGQTMDTDTMRRRLRAIACRIRCGHAEELPPGLVARIARSRQGVRELKARMDEVYRARQELSANISAELQRRTEARQAQVQA